MRLLFFLSLPLILSPYLIQWCYILSPVFANPQLAPFLDKGYPPHYCLLHRLGAEPALGCTTHSAPEKRGVKVIYHIGQVENRRKSEKITFLLSP